uniref:Uncharacterized protein n=1 Tax=Aegilops tauschii subsp. strangulata TaxID=200361 RepID=A0A453ACG0_AEGTS
CRLWTREENEIAIVTHSSFLDFTLNMYSKECHPTIAEDMRKRFANCELRSMVLVDRSNLGSDTPTCDFPGKIPAGLDLPSDVADKKHIEEASNGNRGAAGCLEHTHMSSPTRLISI